MRHGTPVVVLEPSRCAVFRDELNGLMPESARAHRLMENTFTLSEFLQKDRQHLQFPKINRKALVQAHCHHKAIMRLHDEEELMKQIGLYYIWLKSCRWRAVPPTLRMCIPKHSWRIEGAEACVELGGTPWERWRVLRSLPCSCLRK